MKTLKIDNIEFTLNPEAPPSNYKKKQSDLSPSDPIVEGQLSEDDLLFWSSAGIPEKES